MFNMFSYKSKISKQGIQITNRLDEISKNLVYYSLNMYI